MELRSPTAFAVAVLCLFSSASLGILIHDAEVGTISLDDAEPGDSVRFRAIAEDADGPHAFLQAWRFHGVQADVLVFNDAHVIVLHGEESLDDGPWIIEGTLKGRMAHDGHSMPIVQAHEVTAPILFD